MYFPEGTESVDSSFLYLLMVLDFQGMFSQLFQSEVVSRTSQRHDNTIRSHCIIYDKQENETTRAAVGLWFSMPTILTWKRESCVNKNWEQKSNSKQRHVRVSFTLQKTEHVTKMFRYLKWRY